MAKKFIIRLGKKTKVVFAKIIRTELQKKNIDHDAFKKAISNLKKRWRTFEPLKKMPGVSDEFLKKLELMLKTLPAQFDRNMLRISLKYEHLFDAKKLDPDYLKNLGKYTELVNDPQFEKLIKDPTNNRQFEKIASSLMMRFPIDRYSNLASEQSLYNAIAKKLDPSMEYFVELNAHHLLDRKEEILKQFSKTWKMLGWNSTDDFPAIALMYEGHILSPQRKIIGKISPTLQKLATEKDVKSFTKELSREIGDVDKYKTPEALVKAYKDFYAKRGRGWEKAVEALEQVEKDLLKLKEK